MTFVTNPRDERADDAGWPWYHRKSFLERLAAQGYAAVTIQEYRTIAGRFCDAIEKRGLRIGDLDAATTERLRHSVLSGVTGGHRSYAKFCARRFIDHLVEAGAANPAQAQRKKSTPLERLRAEYENYLRKQRGLAESTIYHCTRFMERFPAFRFGDKLGDLNAITPDDIVAFICALKAGSHPRRQKALPSHLRSRRRRRTHRLRTLRSSTPCCAMHSSGRASSRRRSMSALICSATVWLPTCFGKERRWTRSATYCAIARA